MKIDMIAEDGTDVNLNHILRILKQKYKTDFAVVDSSKKLLTSTFDHKCCWCDEVTTEDIVCHQCAELFRKGYWNPAVDRRYKDGVVLKLQQKDIEILTRDEMQNAEVNG